MQTLNDMVRAGVLRPGDVLPSDSPEEVRERGLALLRLGGMTGASITFDDGVWLQADIYRVFRLAGGRPQGEFNLRPVPEQRPPVDAEVPAPPPPEPEPEPEPVAAAPEPEPEPEPEPRKRKTPLRVRRGEPLVDAETRFVMRRLRFKQNVPVKALCKLYNLSQSSINRILRDER